MSIYDRKDWLRRYLMLWESSDVDALRTMLNADSVTHHASRGDVEAVKFEVEACETWHAAFSNVTISVDLLTADNEYVTAYWRMKSTHTGEFAGIEPAGKQVSVHGMEIHRVVDGKSAEIWRISDTMQLMQQLGAV